jgi:hypothetical protein
MASERNGIATWYRDLVSPLGAMRAAQSGQTTDQRGPARTVSDVSPLRQAASKLA